jgi:selenocysteine-specific elongation factor
VSGLTGKGVDELLLVLDELAVGSGNGRGGSLARLPVDRVFVLKGIGVIATGTLWSGEIRPGDTLYTVAGHRPRVRGAQNHGRPTEIAYAGARTALDLVGIEASELEPGDVLLSSPIAKTRAFDARVRLLEGAPPLKHGTSLRLYHGTRATDTRIRLLDRGELLPGESVLCRLVLQGGLVALPGDRFVLRSSSPQITVGGGTVLDPAPTGRRPEPGWLEALEKGDWGRVVPLALRTHAPRRGMTVEELSLIVPAGPAEVSAAAESSPQVARLSDLYVLTDEAEAGRERLLGALRRRARDRPESPELSTAEARAATGLDARLADALISEMVGGDKPELRTVEASIVLPGSEQVPLELEREAGGLLKTLRGAGAEPPALGDTPAARLLIKRGEAVQLGGGLLASADVTETVLEEIKSACQEEGEVTLAGFRDRLKTSRRYAQAWLEYADAVGVTRRVGDGRVLTRRYR